MSSLKKKEPNLEEKAAEYFIDPDKLKMYLDNPFLGHETFKMFIDQICEDGCCDSYRTAVY